MTALLTYLRYRKIERSIGREMPGTSGNFLTWFVGVILVCGCLLIVYLVLHG